MPPAWKILADDMKRTRRPGPTGVPNMGGVQAQRRQGRNFVAPPAEPPAPGQFRGRPPGTMARARNFQVEPPPAQFTTAQTGGIKPAPPNNVGQPVPPGLGPPPRTGGVRSPFGPAGPSSWMPQPDPALVRRAKYGEWVNLPGAPEPELDPGGSDFNPFLGRYVR